MGKKLFHYTNADALQEILKTKILHLEGEHFVNNQLAYTPQQIKWLDEQYTACGRYVWFTEANTYNSSTDLKNECGLVIDSDQIEVKKWHYVKRDRKNDAAFTKVAMENDAAAKAQGDDPYVWWVSSKPIDLNTVEFQCFFRPDVMERLQENQRNHFQNYE